MVPRPAMTMPVAFATLLALLMTGCNRGAKHQLTAVAQFDQGTPQEAIAAFDKAAEARGAEHEIIAADRAIAALMAGDVAAAEDSLRKTRQQMDFLRQKDVTERTKAFVTDDKAIAWSGREFEQRMVDNLLILSSLMGNRQDAFAYANQAMEHVHSDRTALESKPDDRPIATVGHSESPPDVVVPSARTSVNAFSAYLHAAIRSENPMDTDETKTALQQVSYWSQQKPSTTINTSLNVEYGFGTLCPQGQGAVHVVTFVERITDWKVEHSVPTTSALLLADQILSAIGDHTLPPTVAPVSIARPVKECCPQRFVTRARVVGASTDDFVTSTTLVDLNTAAHDSYLANRDEQIARAVARRVIKKSAIYAAKDQMAVAGGSGADVLMNLGGIAWEALEKADTRHLHLLPGRIEVVQLNLPAGDHQLDIWSAQRTDNQSSNVSQSVRIPVKVDDGRNTIVLCFRPHNRLVGSILTSDGSPAIQLN